MAEESEDDPIRDAFIPSDHVWVEMEGSRSIELWMSDGRALFLIDLTPKNARRLARRLKRAARVVKERRQAQR